MQVTQAIMPEPFKIQVVEDTELSRHQPRFFVQMGWERLSVDADSVPKKEFRRGIVTPVASYQKLEHKYLIPETKRIPGSESNDRDGKPLYAKMWIHAVDEAARLVQNEESSDHK